MFSSRFRWDLRPNRLARAVEKRRHSGAPLLDLTESNPTRAGVSYPEAEILEALGNRRSLLYEPAAAGSSRAREAVSAWYAERGQEVEPERILLTASTSEAYAYLFKLLTDPGDEVLVPRPSYPLFEFLAAMESVRVAHYPLQHHGSWSIDLDALARAVTPRTRAVVTVSPNNPTGSFLKSDELSALTELCRRGGLALVSDEVFADYAFAPDPRRAHGVAGVDEVLCFALNGLSKAAGLPQMKLGWIVMAGPPEVRREALARLELIADTYLSVGTPVQHAAPRLLDLGASVREQILVRARGNLANLSSALGEAPSCRLLHVEGGWNGIVQVPRVRSEEEWAVELLDRGVLVQPGYFYDFESEAFLVVSLLTPPEVFRVGIEKIVAALRQAD